MNRGRAPKDGEGHDIRDLPGGPNKFNNSLRLGPQAMKGGISHERPGWSHELHGCQAFTDLNIVQRQTHKKNALVYKKKQQINVFKATIKTR